MINFSGNKAAEITKSLRGYLKEIDLNTLGLYREAGKLEIDFNKNLGKNELQEYLDEGEDDKMEEEGEIVSEDDEDLVDDEELRMKYNQVGGQQGGMDEEDVLDDSEMNELKEAVGI